MADNIYKKMLAITNEIASVAKNLTVGYGGAGYKAVSEADVLAAVKPIECKYGIYSYPVNREIIESGEMVNGQKKQVYLRVMTTYRFVNTDNPTEYIDIISYGDGVDSQDKAPGKAMTYADKYALLKAYKIRTGEDTDQELSQPLESKTARKPTSKPAITPIGPAKAKALEGRIGALGADLEKICQQYKVKSLAELTEEQHAHLHQVLLKYENDRKN